MSAASASAEILKKNTSNMVVRYFICLFTILIVMNFIVPCYWSIMLIRYLVNEERCKRLWSSWTQEKSPATVAKQKAKKVFGWDQWTMPRLRVFVQHFSKNGVVLKTSMNKATLIGMLPPWRDELEEELRLVGEVERNREVQGDELSDGDSDADAEDRAQHVDMEMFEDDESTLAETVGNVEPPEQHKGKRRKANDCGSKPKAKRRIIKRCNDDNAIANNNIEEFNELIMDVVVGDKDACMDVVVGDSQVNFDVSNDIPDERRVAFGI